MGQNFRQKIFSSQRPAPSIPLVFLLVAILSLLQFATNFFMQKVSSSAGILINEIIFIAGLPILIAAILHFNLAKIFPFNLPRLKLLIYAILLTIPFAVVIDYFAAGIEHFFPLPTEYYVMLERLMFFENTWEFIFKLFLLCVLPGVCEEIFFRGFCQNSLEKKWGSNKAILITAALFALLHGNPWYLLLYFFLGLFLSWVYAQTKTLWIPICCHIVNNAVTFISHSLEIDLPLKGFKNLTDLSIIIVALILVISLFFVFKRLSRQIKPRPTS
ncbi:MAG: type II CAAX endopeptidase family protein [Pseudomonadota bacterium]